MCCIVRFTNLDVFADIDDVAQIIDALSIGRRRGWFPEQLPQSVQPIRLQDQQAASSAERVLPYRFHVVSRVLTRLSGSLGPMIKVINFPHKVS